MPWGYALCSYCVGGTKYAVGIPNILRIISMGVTRYPRIYGAGVPKTGEDKYPVIPVYGEISQFENGLTPAGLAPASSCSFFERKVLCFPASCTASTFSCNCFSAMAKSAYHDARPLPFLTSMKSTEVQTLGAI